MPRPANTPELLRFGKFLGTTIKATRKRKGMKAYSLGLDAGVTQQSISLIETGMVLPSFATLHRISQALEVPMWQMVRAAERYAAMDATMKQERSRTDDDN